MVWDDSARVSDYLQAEERLERWVRDRLPYMDANERKDFGVLSQSCSRS